MKILPILLLISAFSFIQLFAGENKTSQEYMLFISKDLKTNAIKDRIEITIKREGVNSRWIEKRETEDGSLDEFNVLYNPANFIPLSYSRKISKGGKTSDIEISVRDREIICRAVHEDGEVKTDTLSTGNGQYIIEPFLKKYISSSVLKGEKTGRCRLIIYLNGSLRDTEIQWEYGGTETINVAGKSLPCVKYEAGPVNIFMQALIPPATSWFNTGNLGEPVLTLGKRTRFESMKKTELIEYRTDK